MVDIDPTIRPLEAAPLTPARERQGRGKGRPFDLERELGRRPEAPAAEAAQPQPQSSEHADLPLAPRGAEEAGGRLDLTA
jgi:hypothetical protein